MTEKQKGALEWQMDEEREAHCAIIQGLKGRRIKTEDMLVKRPFSKMLYTEYVLAFHTTWTTFLEGRCQQCY